MRRTPRLIAAAVLIAFTGILGGCSSFDPSDMLDFLDTKKKLPGDRKPVFPEGVPGLEQGVPREMYKGAAQQQPDPNAPAVAALPPPSRRPRPSRQRVPRRRRPNSLPAPRPRPLRRRRARSTARPSRRPRRPRPLRRPSRRSCASAPPPRRRINPSSRRNRPRPPSSNRRELSRHRCRAAAFRADPFITLTGAAFAAHE
ncbi:hypothetical protein ACVWZ3_003128 [Bradyrhizobium sp. i1.3.6]